MNQFNQSSCNRLNVLHSNKKEIQLSFSLSFLLCNKVSHIQFAVNLPEKVLQIFLLKNFLIFFFFFFLELFRFFELPENSTLYPSLIYTHMCMHLSLSILFYWVPLFLPPPGSAHRQTFMYVCVQWRGDESFFHFNSNFG
jgi:hypothetical protein